MPPYWPLNKAHLLNHGLKGPPFYDPNDTDLELTFSLGSHLQSIPYSQQISAHIQREFSHIFLSD